MKFYIIKLINNPMLNLIKKFINKIVDFFSWDFGNWWGSDKDIKAMWRNLWN